MVLILSESQPQIMNSYPENISASLENSRNCLRRIARNDDTEFSHQSILNVMEKFVKTVNTMDETILVPCRLMDLKVGDESEPECGHKHQSHKSKSSVHKMLNSADLFQIYNMLNSVKDGLLWGQCQDSSSEEVTSVNATSTVVKGHVRRPSTVSVASTNSSASILSDTESEAGSGNENDSGIEETVQEGCFGDGRTDRVADDFRRHLDGLTRSLRQMTDAAQYLTWRYQHDIGGPV